MKSLPLSEAKARLSELVEQATRTHERVSITRHGRPAAVLLSADDFEAIEETLHWMSHPAAAELRSGGDEGAGDDTRDDADLLRTAMAQRLARGE